MNSKTYIVKRHMTGERDYVPGDERDLFPHEAAPLLASGAIVEKGDAPSKNKAEKGAPKNKAG